MLDGIGLQVYPKTSGSKGIHVMVRIVPEWDFLGVRRAALALAREVERRIPELATSKWWKEERHGVFVDYNQNARDRTIASAYSVRARIDATVSAPFRWDELDGDLIPREWRRHARVGPGPHRIGGGDRPILRVLVVVEEDAVALLLPPLARR